jgi:hemolysin activation/secretion protein
MLLCLLALPLAFAGLGLGAASAVAAVEPEPIVVQTHADTGVIEGAEGEPCFPVDEIRITGVTLIDAAEIERRVAPLAAQCLGNNVARALVAAINEAHAEIGLITTQGYLPEQDIRATRALAIEVIPGRIDRIVYTEDHGEAALPLRERLSKSWERVASSEGPWALSGNLSALFQTLDDPLDRFQLINAGAHPGVKRWLGFEIGEGDILDVEHLQRGVERINAVPSGRAGVRLEPGAEPATSTVHIENQPVDGFRVLVGYERNAAALSGSGTTIAERIRVDVAKDNLIGINDSWRSSFASGVNSNEISMGVTLPIRRATFSIDGSYSESYQQITPFAGLFSQSGTIAARLSYLLSRDKRHQTRLDGSLTWRGSERHINDLRLTPQRLTVARIGLSQTWTLGERSQFSYGGGVSRGLTWFEATRDASPIAATAPRAQFWKLDGFAAYAHGFSGVGLFRSELSSQWSPTPLYSDDQLTLGSSASVRGFSSSLAKADRGIVLRNDFVAELPVAALLGESREDLAFLADVLGATKPYAFVDFGIGHDLASDRRIERAGGGFGVRYAHGRTNLDLNVAYPLHDRGARPGGRPDVSLMLSFKLF